MLMYKKKIITDFIIVNKIICINDALIIKSRVRELLVTCAYMSKALRVLFIVKFIWVHHLLISENSKKIFQ